MIFFANADGSVKQVITNPIYQNSNNAAEVVLIAPYTNATATVAFTLPNGLNTSEYLMSTVDLGSYMQVAPNKTYCAYRATLDSSVTEYAGLLTVQFFLYLTNTSTVLSTFATTVDIQPGVPVLLPETPTPDIYAQILKQLQGVVGLDNITTKDYNPNYDNGAYTQTTLEVTKTKASSEEAPQKIFVEVYAKNGNVSFNELTEAQKESLKGATFTPSVSEEGVISWTNDGDLTNPPEVNIKGPAGASGVYVGTNTPPDNANVWIDPNGTATTVQMHVVYTDDTIADFNLYIEAADE